MTWAETLSFGNGTVGYRLMIEGWPYEFVTTAAITHATNSNGRGILNGLLYQGLALHERVIMQEASIEADGITFKIVPTDSRELTMQAFSFYPEPIAMLGDSVDAAETGAGFTYAGGTIAIPSVFHIGTEAIKRTASNTYIRQYWDTQPQSHNTQISGSVNLPVYCYGWPPAMEGRRAYLFVYGRGDDGAGDGTCIWRGIVATPPTLDSDGATWMIACHPITKVLSQQVAGYVQEAKPAFINHHYNSALYVEMSYGNLGSNLYQGRKLVGIDTEASLINRVNSLPIAYIASAISWNVSHVSVPVLQKTGNGWAIYVRTVTGAPDIYVSMLSPIIGCCRSSYDKWQDNNGNTLSGYGSERLNDNTDYYCYLKPNHPDIWAYPQGYAYNGMPVMPLGPINQMVIDNGVSSPAGVISPALLNLTSGDTTGQFYPTPMYRIFVDTDMTGVELVHISGTYHPSGMFQVFGTGSVTLDDYDGNGTDLPNVFYIDLTDPTNPTTGVPVYSILTVPPGLDQPKQFALTKGFFGFLDGSTTITALRKYATGARIGHFINALKITGVFANDGDTPFVTDADITDWLGAAQDGNDPIQTQRNYWFAKPKDLETILKAELVFQNCFMRLSPDGHIDIKALPSFTDQMFVDAAHSIDGSSILTPVDGRGAWPGWQPQRDGLITAVEVKQDYNPIDDDWKGKSASYQQPQAVAIHKTRGKVQATIAPYSGAPPVAENRIRDVHARIAATFLAAFSREYAIITIKVPFKHFAVLCGDVVSLTHRLIPAGDGTRGINGRRGVVVERRWNLDPAQPEQGELSIYIPREPEVGYTPSAKITSQVHVTANLWTITCSLADSLNIEWSTNGDGRVIEHFQVGDLVLVFQIFNPVSFTPISGTVTSVSPDVGIIGINFNSTWTPGSSTWLIEFTDDNSGGTNSTAHQKSFCYVADATLTLPGGGFARRFS